MLGRGVRAAAWDVAARQKDEPPRASAGPAWPSSLSWKLKFVGTAVVMFLGYSAVTALLDLTQARGPRTAARRDPAAELNCNEPGTSIEVRAACIVARDDARDAERKARREKEAAEHAKRRAEQKALDEEVDRQRLAARARKLTAEYESRIEAITTGGKRFAHSGEKSIYLEETLGVLIRLLTVTDAHPAKNLRWKIEKLRPSDAVAVINNDGKETPDYTVTADVDRICVAHSTPGWRDGCGKALTQHALKLPVSTTRFHLGAIVNSTPLSTDK